VTEFDDGMRQGSAPVTVGTTSPGTMNMHSFWFRSGFGKLLLVALIQRAKAIGKHVMVAGDRGRQAGPIRLHEELDFIRVGMLPRVGTKVEAWLDLVFLQLMRDAPINPVPFSEPPFSPHAGAQLRSCK
jgi:hypothetical protein